MARRFPIPLCRTSGLWVVLPDLDAALAGRSHVHWRLLLFLLPWIAEILAVLAA
jgi:hypothetical protein